MVGGRRLAHQPHNNSRYSTVAVAAVAVAAVAVAAIVVAAVAAAVPAAAVAVLSATFAVAAIAVAAFAVLHQPPTFMFIDTNLSLYVEQISDYFFLSIV
jgi:uncharacterized membrane protein